MNKSGTLIASALLTVGLAAGAMAADMPKTAPAMSADAKKHHKHKKAAATPSSSK
jgi:hypothetical protein